MSNRLGFLIDKVGKKIDNKNKSLVYSVMAVILGGLTATSMTTTSLVQAEEEVVNNDYEVSQPVSVYGVAPVIVYVDGENPRGGNRTCAEIGEALFGDSEHYSLGSERNDHQSEDEFTHDWPEFLSVEVTDDYDVAWTLNSESNWQMGAVIVKGSNNANIYVYDETSLASPSGEIRSDSGLASPDNPGDQESELSNLTFCWNHAADENDGDEDGDGNGNGNGTPTPPPGNGDNGNDEENDDNGQDDSGNDSDSNDSNDGGTDSSPSSDDDGGQVLGASATTDTSEETTPTTLAEGQVLGAATLAATSSNWQLYIAQALLVLGAGVSLVIGAYEYAQAQIKRQEVKG